MVLREHDGKVYQLGRRDILRSSVNSNVVGRDLVRVSENSLLRGLIVSGQAVSIGMVGWLEYGSSSILDRSIYRSFEILQGLSTSHAKLGRWAVFVDIL